MIFLDEAEIEVTGGRGGNGCLAFRREKFVPRGGPSGGDGGHGGSIHLVGSKGRNTLYHLRGKPRLVAERGRHGEGSNKTGRSGQDREIEVALGTLVIDADSGEVVGEVLGDGERLLVASGGRGGRGNARFATPTQRAPRRVEPGIEGEHRRLRLELKLLADVGLVGLPNAGKSTLISTISAARPKIADYPFTTVVPNLGVVAEHSWDDPFVIADLPGLIEGAAEGTGLGHQFLRHVERCRVLVHLVDLSSTEEGTSGGDAEADLAVLEQELVHFNAELLDRSRLVVGSKLDAAREDRRDSLRQAAENRRLAYFEISAATHDGLDTLVHALRERMAEAPDTTDPGGSEEGDA